MTRENEIKEIVASIRGELETDVDPNNGQELVERITRLVALLPRSAFCVALSKEQLTEARYLFAKSHTFVNATVFKIELEAKTKTEQYYHDISVQQSKELHYTIEATRTLISYLKTELNNLHHHEG